MPRPKWIDMVRDEVQDVRLSPPPAIKSKVDDQLSAADDLGHFSGYGRRSVSLSMKTPALDPMPAKPKPPKVTFKPKSEELDTEYKRGKDYSMDFEDYIGKTFQPMYDHFESDRNLKRLAAEGKARAKTNSNLILCRMEQDEKFPPGKYAVGELFAELKAEKEKGSLDQRPSFEVYKPKMYSQSASTRTPYVSLIECRREQMAPPTSYDFSTSSRSRPYISTSGMGASGDTKYTQRSQSAVREPPPDRYMKIDHSRSSRQHGTIPTSVISTYRTDFLRPQDSLIAGSDFVIIKQRQPDSWFERTDKLLAEVRGT